MAEKQAILDNVVQYSAEELVDFIQQGIVSFNELVSDTDGQFDPQKRKKVRELLTEMGDLDEISYKKVVEEEKTVEACDRYLQQFPDGKHRDDVRDLKDSLMADAGAAKAWSEVDKKSEGQLKDFISSFPDSVYASEARRLYDELSGGRIINPSRDDFVQKVHGYQVQKYDDAGIAKWIQSIVAGGKIKKEDILESIREDHNFLSATTVKALIDQLVISIADLQSIGIEDVFIKKMYSGEKPLRIEPSLEKFKKVERPATEIYFWGIPSSGKSCALGAILSVANNGDVASAMFPDDKSQGYGYMFQLMNLFSEGSVNCLMGGTAIDEFYELGFDLVDAEGTKVHPITCIDMAGELMRCLYKKNAKADMDISEKAMVDTLHDILIDKDSNNRKIHFFVVEYGAENKMYEGLRQDAFLSGAMTYLINTGIFNKNTDAIYILISKADKAKDQSRDAIKNYIMKNYKGFFNALNQICKYSEINGGKVDMVAFTLGDVCFQDFCKFDSRPAANIVRMILEKSYGKKMGKWDGFINKLKG